MRFRTLSINSREVRQDLQDRQDKVFSCRLGDKFEQFFVFCPLSRKQKDFTQRTPRLE